ncbi:hypothetical protein B5M09_008598 [Aphanomyces astaci]|uniref:Uncharacterized protein n=1 Tax=Aphanomyces astaci TaxID=112090 RepID=A0A3R7WF54_APHAT|nr:hypothetical protein B5M09_008598 [Aphanomyces astaci]
MALVPFPANNDPSGVRDDMDMGRYGGYDRTAPQVWNAPAIPQPPTFSGSIKAERRAFMLEYLKYLRQINDMQCNGSRAFAMSVSACMNPFSKRRIALLDCNRDHNSITNYEWVAWFKSAFEDDPQDLDVLKQCLQRRFVSNEDLGRGVPRRSHVGRDDALVGMRSGHSVKKAIWSSKLS